MKKRMMEQILAEQTNTSTLLASGSSFLEVYKNYASLLTDAPDVYHDFSALSLLSLAVGRTPIRISPAQKYPNLWLIFIGRSGLDRKSSAIHLALSVLPDDYKTLPSDFSPEGLQESLGEQSQGLIWREEISGFLENIKKRDYMSGMADLLCHLFDCPARYSRTLRKASFNLNDVCFNIMATTTPSRFNETVALRDFNSGFLSRFLIVYGKKTLSLPRRRWMSSDTERLNECRKLWKEVYDAFHEQKIEFEFAESALELANAWQSMKEEEAMQCDEAKEADLKGAVVTRLADYVVKLSALYEVDSVSSDFVSRLVESPLLISTNSVQKACSTIDNILTLQTTNLLTLLTSDNISTRLVKLTNVLKAKANSEGWLRHGVLLQFMNASAYELKVLLQTAYERELIEVKQEGKARYYRIKTEKD
jgi:hypothetical protein